MLRRIVPIATFMAAGITVAAQQLSPIAPPKNDHVPPSDVYVADALAHSPRHGEWVDVKMPDGQAIKTWVVYPQVSGKAGVVLVIHEIFGMSDWVRAVADQVAKDGFIAVAPDLLSGFGPNGGGSAEAGSQATTVIRQVTPEIAAARLDAAMAYGASLPASNGKTAVMGFCWGGNQSLAYATHQPALVGAIAFYGMPPMTLVDGKQVPDVAKLKEIRAPVLAFYGGNDNRVTSTADPTAADMKQLGKSFEPHVYDGAGHGFMREQGNNQELTNYKAADQAWPRVVAFLRQHLG